MVRKGIARVLTVVNQKQREALREAYSGKVRSAARWMGRAGGEGAGSPSAAAAPAPLLAAAAQTSGDSSIGSGGSSLERHSSRAQPRLALERCAAAWQHDRERRGVELVADSCGDAGCASSVWRRSSRMALQLQPWQPLQRMSSAWHLPARARRVADLDAAGSTRSVAAQPAHGRCHPAPAPSAAVPLRPTSQPACLTPCPPPAAPH